MHTPLHMHKVVCFWGLLSERLTWASAAAATAARAAASGSAGSLACVWASAVTTATASSRCSAVSAAALARHCVVVCHGVEVYIQLTGVEGTVRIWIRSTSVGAFGVRVLCGRMGCWNHPSSRSSGSHMPPKKRYPAACQTVVVAQGGGAPACCPTRRLSLSVCEGTGCTTSRDQCYTLATYYPSSRRNRVGEQMRGSEPTISCDRGGLAILAGETTRAAPENSRHQRVQTGASGSWTYRGNRKSLEGKEKVDDPQASFSVTLQYTRAG